jgi:menaquinone-dependent protoporphyrinogen oxidase
MNVLIAVASKRGSTKEIAEVMASEMRNAGHRVSLRTPDHVRDLCAFDAVVAGSGVYMGRWLPEARSFAERNAAELKDRPVWLFNSGPIGDPPKPAADPDDLTELSALVGARGYRTFAGKLDPEDLGFKERLLIKVVRSETGDFRDWDEIKRWTHEILVALEAMEPSLVPTA